jgi:hypothetical protein
MKNIATALVKAQQAFGPALKKSVNPAFVRNGKGGKYADLASCIDAVMDSLNSNGIALVQQNQPHPDGILVETVFIHESGEMLNCGQIFVPAAKHDPQGYGSALTYARRYSLMAACNIAPEDDDGNAASGKKEFISTVNESQITDLMAAMDETTTIKELFEAHKLAYAAANGEPVWQKIVLARKDAKKTQLEGK